MWTQKVLREKKKKNIRLIIQLKIFIKPYIQNKQNKECAVDKATLILV